MPQTVENLSHDVATADWLPDDETVKRVGAVMGVTLGVLLTARKMTKKAQLSKKASFVAPVVVVLASVAQSGGEALMTHSARALSTDELPLWWTFNHVELMVRHNKAQEEPTAVLVAPLGHYRVLVNPAFLAADNATQRDLFNAALGNDNSDRIAVGALSLGRLVAIKATRDAFVGDRQVLSKRRALAFAVTTAVQGVVLQKTQNAIMGRLRPNHLRAHSYTVD